jgi:hypothetical protein
MRVLWPLMMIAALLLFATYMGRRVKRKRKHKHP